MTEEEMEGVILFRESKNILATYNDVCNKPLLSDNMYPVYWNEEVSRWEVIEEDDSNCIRIMQIVT